jgi:S1/P1 Nuclease
LHTAYSTSLSSLSSWKESPFASAFDTYNIKESLMFLVHFMGDIHQPLHCSRTTDRGGNSIHVHYHVLHYRSQNADTTGTTASSNQQQQQLYQEPRRRQRQRRGVLRTSTTIAAAVATTTASHSSLNLHAVWDDRIIETMLQHDFHSSRNAMENSLVSYIWNVRLHDPTTYTNRWLNCTDASNVQCVTQWGQESFAYAMQYAYSNVDGTAIVDGTTLEEEYYVTRQAIVRSQLAIAAVRLAINLEVIFGVNGVTP